MNSTLDNSFVERLRQILNNRYGKNLHIRQLLDTANVGSEEFSIRGADLHIPIRVNGFLLGTAVVPTALDLNAEKKQSVAQLVRMALEPAMYKWYLDQKEANLIEISKAEVSFDNIRIFGESPLPPIDEILAENLDELNKSPDGQLVSHIIHLDGKSVTTNKKVALQLHELTGRWAFVPFADVKAQLHSAQDLARLGAMTIYVEAVEDLNSAEQGLLTDYISEEHFGDVPLIVTSSSTEIDDLYKKKLSSTLLDEMSINCFEVDRAPLTADSLKEVLQLFFLKDGPYDA
jgi:hypothetical protein